MWHSFAKGRRTMAERHMRRVLGDGADAVRAARRVMRSYGRYYSEALWARGKRVDELGRTPSSKDWRTSRWPGMRAGG